MCTTSCGVLMVKWGALTSEENRDVQTEESDLQCALIEISIAAIRQITAWKISKRENQLVMVLFEVL